MNKQPKQSGYSHGFRAYAYTMLMGFGLILFGCCAWVAIYFILKGC